MSDNGTIKVEIELPVRVYRALEFICSTLPEESMNSYLARTLEMDALGVADSGWPDHVEYLSKKIKEILNS